MGQESTLRLQDATKCPNQKGKVQHMEEEKAYNPEIRVGLHCPYVVL